MRNHNGSLDLVIRAESTSQLSGDVRIPASSTEAYNTRMAKYTGVLEDIGQEDIDIINNPKLQNSRAPMPKKIVRKDLPYGGWTDVLTALKSKSRMEIPTVESVGSLDQSLEAVDVRDLQVGNVLCFVSVDRCLGDLNGMSGEGWFYEPKLHVYEVVDTDVKQEFESPFGKVKVRALQTGHPLQSNILEYTNDEGLISNPLIARGLHVQFIDARPRSGRSPTTAAVHGLYVFKDKRSITGDEVLGARGYRG